MCSPAPRPAPRAKAKCSTRCTRPIPTCAASWENPWVRSRSTTRCSPRSRRPRSKPFMPSPSAMPGTPPATTSAPFPTTSALDPNFATAYARLGTVYNNLGQTKLSEQNRKRAFELRDRASEREKLYIMSHYYTDSGQYDKGITALELYQQTFPRDSTPANNLSNLYNQLGQYENALGQGRRAVELEPDSMSGYFNLALAYAGLNRMEEAKATAQAGLQRIPGNGELHWMLAGIGWNQNDDATVDSQLQATETLGAGGKMLALNMRAALAASHGEFRKMRSFLQTMQETASASNLQEAVAAADAQRSSWEALAGFQALARQTAERALKGFASSSTVLNSALTLSLLHADARALKVANDVSVQRPYDTMVQFV